jgi:hypothetical protein
MSRYRSTSARHALTGILAAALAVAHPAGAQGPAAVSDVDRRARAAEAAPLFGDTTPLRLTIATDLARLRGERPDSVELDGVLSFGERGSAPVELPVKVRARGNFRREARNCSFPPVRLNVPKGAVEGTAFEGQDKLKLVSPCRTGRATYEALVHKEYLAYRTWLLLSPIGFRVRLLDVTWVDLSGEDDPLTVRAFAIEDDDAMAARNRAEISEWERFHPASLDGAHAALVDLFQFMIGNTDWSSALFHNTVMIRDDQARYLVVPYDFDFSGLVEAPYAAPDPELPIRDVRERLYRGYCRPDADMEALVALFTERRPAITELWSGFEWLDDGARRRALDYFETFYRTIETPATFRREVTRMCMSLPA